MTISEFQRIVLRIGNQMPVRHFLWLSYPNDPQVMGIQLPTSMRGRKYERTSSCDCGTCRKCKHRDYMRRNRPKDPDSYLYAELERLGFVWNDDLKLWTIERTET